MKKSLIALAALAAVSGSAMAQSSVTISGTLDQGIINKGAFDAASGAAQSVTTLGGSGSAFNSLTFSGVEDLGGGNSAFFALNHRLNLQSGTQNGQNGTTAGIANASDSAAQFWRQDWVGLKSNAVGDVRLGRMLLPLQELNGVYDIWYGGYTVASVHTDGRAANAATNSLRTNETIYVRSASFSGISVHVASGRKTGGGNNLQFTTGAATVGGNTADLKAPFGAAIVGAFGPASFAIATDTNGNNKKGIGLYGKYDFGVAILNGQFEKSDTNATATDGNAQKDKRYSIAADIPLGPVIAKVGYRHMDRADIDGSNKKFGLGAEYLLSKRTKLYADMGKTSGSDGELVNSNAATLTAAQIGAAAAARKTAFDIGVRHSF